MLVNALDYNFTYTGSTPDSATYFWDFGTNATPQFSTEENPRNILFNTDGEHTVTLTMERFGCASTLTQTIEVQSVHCGNNNNNKILVCHSPDGNQNNAHAICIAEDALQAHLDQGACIGECNIILNKSAQINIEEGEELNLKFEEYLAISQNPVLNEATINFATYGNNVTIKVINSIGEIEDVFTININKKQEPINLMYDFSRLKTGVYFVVLIGSHKRLVSKLVKY